MNVARKSLWVILGIVILFLYASFYTVNEGQKALLLRLGQIVQDKAGVVNPIGPGLHFKIPFINQTRKLDIRLQTVTAQSSRIVTLDQKYVIVDYYIKWQIQDLPLYYQRTGGDAVLAQNLLQQQVNDALRAAFGERTLTDMVSGERINVMVMLKNSANATAKNLGIAVADVRIKSIDLPKEVSEAVFNNMRTNREKDAAQYRANGRAQAEAIIAGAQANAAVTVAQAQMRAAEVRAKAAATAANIYANAYQQDSNFYSFYRSLEAYLTAFNNKNDILVLTPDSDFFRYFNSVQLPPVSAEARAAAEEAAAAVQTVKVTPFSGEKPAALELPATTPPVVKSPAPVTTSPAVKSPAPVTTPSAVKSPAPTTTTPAAPTTPATPAAPPTSSSAPTQKDPHLNDMLGARPTR